MSLQESGQFSVLTANVAGLPAIFSSANPEVNTPLIGKRLSNYDIVNVQEDFAYHDVLYANDKHPFRTVTSGNVPVGSGLNTLSNFPFANTSSTERIQWNKCSELDYFDCLTAKGFSRVQVQLTAGVTVDIYDVHADAGSTTEDLAARTDNARQVIDYILANSTGQAVLVYGDTNALYTDPRDNVREYGSRAHLTDAWVSFVRKGTPPASGSKDLECDLEKTTNDCEVVDKIFFRGNNLVKLELVKYNVESAAFTNSTGQQLSDHVPISATFKWSLNSSLRQSPAFGASGGTSFTDVNSLPVGKVTSVTVRGGSRVNAVTLKVSTTTFRHGGKNGSDKTLDLTEDEYLQSVEIHSGVYSGREQVFYTKFTTSKGRTVAVGSPREATKVVYTAPEGWQIAGLHGRAADEINALGVVYTRV